MGVSSSFVSSSEFLKNIPNDQYACINCECKCIPEITRLDFNKGIITYKCKIDDIENVDIRNQKIYTIILNVIKIIKDFKKIIYHIFLIILYKRDKIYVKIAQNILNHHL